MEEKYLHLIWEMKRLPSNNLTTVDGTEVEILSFGVKNDDLAGPDFFYGKIRYDGITHFGMIEIHVKSSDWHRHKHQNDPRYNNVILHVVFEYDRPVIQNNVEIPTLELKPFLEKDHYLKFKQGRLKTLPILCRSNLETIPSIYLESMKAKALIEKISQKVSKVASLCGTDKRNLLYGLLTLAFGTSRNKNGFERILRRLPLEKAFKNGRLVKQYYSSEANSILFEFKSSSEWNYKGLRPQGSPDIRLQQLVYTLESIEIDRLSSITSVDLIKQECFNFVNSLDLTPFMKNQIMVNVFVPYLWSMGLQTNDEEFKRFAVEFLETLEVENNKVVRMWKKQGVELKTAYDSQALIGVYQYHCSRKKCLSCEVGLKLLKS